MELVPIIQRCFALMVIACTVCGIALELFEYFGKRWMALLAFCCYFLVAMLMIAAGIYGSSLLVKPVQDLALAFGCALACTTLYLSADCLQLSSSDMDDGRII